MTKDDKKRRSITQLTTESKFINIRVIVRADHVFVTLSNSNMGQNHNFAPTVSHQITVPTKPNR